MSSLSDRMKSYEQRSRSQLLPRIPVIIRIDGKSFGSFTRKMNRPWDSRMAKGMWDAALYSAKNLKGARLAYTQSDECSFLLTDWDSYDTQSLYNYRIQKICSIAAGFYTAAFLRAYSKYFQISLEDIETLPVFDARTFNIPIHEVNNYFVWRQQDASRNSVQMLGRAHFSHKKLHKKNNSQIQEMLWKERDINWNSCETWQKRGICIYRKRKENEARQPWSIDTEIPQFTKDRNYIGQHLPELFWKEESHSN